MLKQKIHLFFLIFCHEISSQNIANYVSNGGFEKVVISASATTSSGVENWSAIDSTQGAFLLLSLGAPFYNAPQFSLGFQYPRTGNNFIASEFYCSSCGRWNPKNRLKSQLRPNKTYCVKYYVVNTNNCRIAIDSYGAYFGDNSMDTIKKCNIPLTYLIPQIENSNGIITDTMNWIPVTGTFVANGNEKFMTIGNFRSNATTNTLLINTPTLQTMSNDVYIDDVSLIEMDLPADAGFDKSIPPGDSAFIGRQPDVGIDEACIWYKMTSPTTSVSTDTVAGLWVKPVSTTTYVVKQQLWCANTPKWDTVVVFMNLVGINEQLRVINEQLVIYPLPAQDLLQLKIPNEEWMKEFKIVVMYDHLGRELRREDCVFKNNTVNMDIQDLTNGIYFLELKSGAGQIIRKRFVVNR